MPKCQDQGFPCQRHEYPEFDRIIKSELLNAPTAQVVVCESAYCSIVPIDAELHLDGITSNDFLRGLQDKFGVYQLWIHLDSCDDHDLHTMLCVYVGKGPPEGRVKSHIKEKWKTTELLYVTFYECSNRMAKYLEQLFLDTYKFHLNKKENGGSEYLYAVWKEERFRLGTEIHRMSNASPIFSFDDLPGP